MNIRDQLGYALPRAALRSHPKLRGLGKDAVIAEDFDIGTLKQSVIALDSEGLIASWSEGAEKLFGYTAKEIIGKHVEVIHVRSREALDQEVMTPLLRDGRLDFLSKLVRKSGETFDGHILASVVTSPDGKVTGMVGQILDFAQRQLAEDTLEKHQQMISVSPDMMSLVGPGYRYLAVNDTYETMLGCSKEEIIGHQVWEFTGQEKFDR